MHLKRFILGFFVALSMSATAEVGTESQGVMPYKLSLLLSSIDGPDWKYVRDFADAKACATKGAEIVFGSPIPFKCEPALINK